jgi:hypothetical protein
VPPGTYNVIAESSPANWSPTRIAIGDGPFGEPRIAVAEKDIEDLRIASNTGVMEVVGRGRVVVEGGGPTPRFLLDFGGAGGSINPSPVDGTFQEWMPVGSRKVTITGMPREYVLKAMTYGETNLLETELVLRPSDANTNLLRIASLRQPIGDTGFEQTPRLEGRALDLRHERAWFQKLTRSCPLNSRC